MAVTEGRKKKPPTFQYLPKSRAYRLKKSWIEDHKIRSKWKAQKRREGITNQISAPVETTSNHTHETNTGFESDVSPHLQTKAKSSLPTPDDEHLLHDVGKLSKPIPIQKTDSPRSKRAPRHSHNDRSGKKREAGQPNMKLRMNVLLEKIKRDFS